MSANASEPRFPNEITDPFTLNMLVPEFKTSDNIISSLSTAALVDFLEVPESAAYIAGRSDVNIDILLLVCNELNINPNPSATSTEVIVKAN
jgi:hypothetical protein